MSEKYAFWVTLRPQLDCCHQGKAVMRILDFKPHGLSFRWQVRLLLSKAKPSYVYSILKPHSQSSKSPVSLLPYDAKPSCAYSILKSHDLTSYVYTILKKHYLPRVGPKQLCASAHLGCTRPAVRVLPSYN